MSIQNRRGNYGDFDKSKMLAGEFAVVLQDDPDTADGKAVYMAFSSGSAKRLTTYEDIASDLEAATAEATARAEAAAASISEEAAQIDLNTAAITELKDDLSKVFTEDIKTSLLNCFSHVAWIDDHGQDYYDALEDALYPDTGLVRITAVFTQGSDVIYPTTPLNDLKAYLVVTGYYNNGTTKTITDYSLSGTLEVGTSTITVSKELKTTTFDVTVTAPYWEYEWNATSGELPTGVTDFAEYSWTDEPGTLALSGGTLNFNYIGDCEIEIEFKKLQSYNNSDPQIKLAYSIGNIANTYNGIKYVFDYSAHSGYVFESTAGSLADTGVSYIGQYHTYNLIYENGVGIAKIDGNVVGTGVGVLNSQYSGPTGIFNTYDSKAYYKTIKFRRIQ